MTRSLLARVYYWPQSMVLVPLPGLMRRWRQVLVLQPLLRQLRPVRLAQARPRSA
jgi:hypothetical protein